MNSRQVKLLLPLYDALFFLGLIVYIPLTFWRGRLTLSSLKGRFGFIGGGRARRNGTVWIQAVSVGEVNLIARLVEYVKNNFEQEIVVSTTTVTGNRLAREKYGAFCRVIFFPFDISFIVRRVVRLVNPKVFISVETDL